MHKNLTRPATCRATLGLASSATSSTFASSPRRPAARDVLRPLALAAALAAAYPAQGADWTNPGAGVWQTGSNWSTSSEPDASTTANLANGGAAWVSAPGSTAQELNVLGGSTLQVSGTGVLLIGRGVHIGQGGTAGTLNILSGGQMNTRLSSGTYGVWVDAGSQLLVDGSGSRLNSNGDPIVVGHLTTGTATVSGGAKLSGGPVFLGNSVGSSGVLNIGSGAGAGIIDAPSVRSGDGTGTINFNHNGSNYWFTRDGTSTGAAVDILGRLAVNVSAGTTTLNGNSTYSGGTSVTGGTLRLASANAAGSGAISVGNGATLNLSGTDLTVANGITLNAGATLSGSGSGNAYSGAVNMAGNASASVGASDRLTLSGVLSGAGTLSKTGSGTVVLGNASNNYSGGTTVRAGTVEVASDAALGTGRVTLDGGTLLMSDSLTTALTRQIEVAESATGTVAATAGKTATLRGSLILGSRGTLVLGNAVNNGTIELNPVSMSSGVTGNVRLAGGEVKLMNSAVGSDFAGLGASGMTTTIDAGATLNMNDQAGTINNLQGGGTLNTGASSATVITLKGGSFSGGITGAGGLSLAQGSLTLTGSGTSTYSGTTTISNTTFADVFLNTGAANVLSANSTYRLNYRGFLNLNGFDQTIGALAGNGVINLGGATLTTGGNNASTTLSGYMNGGGGLTKTGSGTLTLAGYSTAYTGTTTVNGGTLRVANADALGSGGVVLNGGTLAGDINLTLNNVVSVASGNTGTLAAASGTALNLQQLSVSGANLVFGGGLDNGTVEIGASVPGAANTVHVVAGTLRAQAGSGGLGRLTNFALTTTIDSGATLDFNGASIPPYATINDLRGTGTVKNDGNQVVLGRANFAGRITGTTGLTVGIAPMFPDLAVLTGANDYTGTTAVNYGTLQVGDGATSGQLGSGAIVNNATLVFNRSDDFTVANTLSGAGTLRKLGAGTLSYTGNGSAYTGITNVNAGTLAVNGSLGGTLNVNTGGLLAGAGSVGTLNVLAGGVVAPGNSSPGNSIGTLTANGNVTFGSGSIYRVQADTAGNADRVNATGSVTLTGGTVDVQAGNGVYARNTTYTILNGATGRTGTFAGVTSNLAFLTPTLAYDANHVYLNLAASSASGYTSVTGTGNQTGVAGALNSILAGGGNALTGQIDNLSAQQARTAFDSMSGTQHSGASQVGSNMSRGFGDALGGHAFSGGGGGGFGGVGAIKGESLAMGMAGSAADMPLQLAGMQMSAALGDASANAASSASYSRPGNNGAPGNGSRDTGAAAGDSGAAASGLGVGRAIWSPNVAGQNGLWGQALGGGGRVASDGNGAGSSYRTGGFMVGYDYALSTRWLLGIAAGYTRATWDASVNGVAPSSGKVTTPQGAVYARYNNGPWMLYVSGSYADHKFDTTRTITIGNSSAYAWSSHRGGEWGVSSQVEYALAAGNWQLRPLLGARYMRLREDGFTETGNSLANLTVSERTTETTTVSGGLRVLRPFNAASAAEGGFELRAVYSHLFGDNNSPVSARLAGQSASFTSNGTPLKRDAMTFGVGVSAKLGRNFSGYLDASYEARGSGQDAYAVGAGGRYVW
jgi:outer membrane autotransporter protein